MQEALILIPSTAPSRCSGRHPSLTPAHPGTGGRSSSSSRLSSMTSMTEPTRDQTGLCRSLSQIEEEKKSLKAVGLHSTYSMLLRTWACSVILTATSQNCRVPLGGTGMVSSSDNSYHFIIIDFSDSMDLFS